MHRNETLLMLLVAVPLAAQQHDPCGPHLTSSIAEPEFTESAVLSPLAQFSMAPDPAGVGVCGYARGGNNPFSPQWRWFRWTPGSAPNVTSIISPVYLPVLGAKPDGSGKLTAVNRGGLDNVRLSKVDPANGVISDQVFVFDTAGLPILTVGFSGVRGPSLGFIDGEAVLYATDDTPDLYAFDLDIDPTSPTYGTASNRRLVASATSGSIKASQPIHDDNGDTVALLITESDSAGSRVYLVDCADPSVLPTSAQSYTVFDPAVSAIGQIGHGSFVVQGSAGLERIGLVHGSSVAAPIGQTTDYTVSAPAPSGTSALCLASLSLGPASTPMAITSSFIVGNICVMPDLVLAQIAANGFARFPIAVPNNSALVGTRLACQAVGAELGTSPIHLGNLSFFEIVP
ncbi:MAG: hypothetical protein KDC98_12540 [Planctomycetes bacterium]|nr:hypothetical protein [Planctomycetota bacterium]